MREKFRARILRLRLFIHRIEEPLRWWLRWWHGGPTEDYQRDFYRCAGCRQIVTWRMIHQGGCDCGLSNKLGPTNVKFREKVKLLFFPFLVRQ